MAAPQLTARHFHPRTWPTWLGVALIKLVSHLPIGLLLACGSALGAFAGLVLRGRRRVVRVNLELCFPELDARERERRVDRHFRDLGTGIFEAALAWFASDARLRARGEVVGLEHLRAAQADGSGVLLLTGHFTTLELGARYLSLAGTPFHAMYRPYANPVLDYFMHRWREQRSGRPALPRDDLRALVRALRQGHAIWYAPDQTLDRRISVFAPFFGVPVGTITATARLAEMGRAKVVPFFPQRVDGRYRIVILPALDAFPSGDELTDATRVNRVLEEGIRLAPTQYFWIHRRFKRVPPGTPKPYTKRRR